MKTKILNLLQEKGNGRSFVELSKIKGFTGALDLVIDNKNIVFWKNMSPESINAITELIDSKKIEMVPTSPLVYHADGEYPTLPIAKQNRAYKHPRWAPVAINKGSKFHIGPSSKRT